MFDTVLLPIDLGHPESWEKAFPMAEKVMSGGSALHIVGVVHDLGSAMVATYLPEGFEQDALKRMKADLDAFAAEHLPEGTHVHVGHGPVPETILRTADQIGADIIVMASHPPDRLRDLLIGSYADSVVRHATLPVLVVR